MPWPGDSEGTFRSSIQAATWPPVYHGCLPHTGIEPESTVLVAVTLSTRPLIGEWTLYQTCCWWQISRSRDSFLLSTKCTQTIGLG